MNSTKSPSEIPGFVQMQAEAFRSFNMDNSEKRFDKGVWYPIEYFDALQADQKQKDGPRIKWLREKNICLEGYLPKKSFDPITNYRFTFRAKTDVLASEALKQVTEGLSLLECATALQLSQYIALRDYIGPINFDTLLSLPKNEFPGMYFQHGAYILSRLYQPVKVQSEEDILPGDICYFKNIKKYLPRHPLGAAVGYNTVCVLSNGHSENKDSPKKYMGFGLSVDGNSSSEIEAHLFKEHTKEPLDPCVYLTALEAQKVGQSSIKETLTWAEFQKERSEDANGVCGRLVLKIQRPRFDRIEQLKTASSVEIRKVIASWS